ncbi:PREDICTED: nuclear nucleic acid-binding protein C1D [Tarenaya hassleriana]|uniref:nuclear nucleic acid-binding protein C1D n=1 Tax=Tarenaya hassleriana TaxID=28532 RepID=UPI00053C3189|nr:PREDICTED: nuclear nucleic acid-binding protein C1D [Tarenaya hassleriana]XP_010541557.1 PREDICTED: nuclear nucleic acid-binding protein C1D [Tarenaya hassleriana]
MGGSDTAASAVVPESATESVNATLASMEELKPQILELMSLCEPEVLSLLPPLQRAKALFLLAEATTTLFTLRLRCTGVHPDDHNVKSEIERLSLYREKLQRSMDRSKEPLRPTTVINRQAATRFIEHSLPDLTSDQRQSMRNLSKGDRSKTKYSEANAKRRKYPSNEKQSVQAAAKEFLEKASRELIGNNENGVKGPLMAVADGSDEEMA